MIINIEKDFYYLLMIYSFKDYNIVYILEVFNRHIFKPNKG